MRVWLGLGLIGLAVCGCENEVLSSAPEASGGTASGGAIASGGASSTGGLANSGFSGSCGAPTIEESPIGFDFERWACPRPLDGAVTGDAKYGVGAHTTFELELETVPPHPLKLVQLRNGVCPEAAIDGSGGLGGSDGEDNASYVELPYPKFVQGAGEVDAAEFTVSEAPARIAFYPTYPESPSNYVVEIESATPETYQGVVALVDVETHEVVSVYGFAGRLWVLLL